MKRKVLFCFVVAFLGTFIVCGRNLEAQSSNSVQQFVGNWICQEGSNVYRLTINLDGTCVSDGLQGKYLVSGSKIFFTRFLGRWSQPFDYYFSTDGKVLFLAGPLGNWWYEKQ